MRASLLSSIERLESRIAPAGVIKVALAGTKLTIMGDDGDNAFSVTALANGTVDLVPTAGTHILFGGVDSATTVNIPVAAPNVIAKLGSGGDTVTLGGTIAGLMLDLGAGADTLTMSDVNVLGKVTVKGGADGDTVNISGTVRFYKDVLFDMGAGDNAITLNSNDPLLAGNWTIKGGVGTDFVSILGNALTFGKNLVIRSGTGPLTVQISSTVQHFAVQGSTTIVAQNGVAEGVTERAGFFDSADSTYFGGTFSFIGGAGQESAVFSSQSAVVFGRDFKVNGGKGQSDAVFSSKVTSIAGRVSLTSLGEGTLGLNAVAQVSVGGAVTFRANGDTSGFAISGPGSIGGPVSATLLGGNGGQMSFLSAPAKILHFAKSVTINSAKAQGLSFTATSVVFDAAVKLTTGASGDFISLDDVSAAAPVTMNTGAGNDSVSVETLTGTDHGSDFLAGLSLVLGAGDDSATFGASTATQQLTTYSGFKVDGGAGTDTLSFAPNGNVLLKPPTILNFEMGT